MSVHVLVKTGHPGMRPLGLLCTYFGQSLFGGARWQVRDISGLIVNQFISPLIISNSSPVVFLF